MKNIENTVIEHYHNGNLLLSILKGLEAAGLDPDNLTPPYLAPVDEFHIGGRKATEHAVSKAGVLREHQVLDIGCGIGGTARYIASTIGSHVTGIDLTSEYIEVAKALTERVGLSDRLHFEKASALAMPLDTASFDVAVTFHVAMNIEDRFGLYTEIARVMKPGASLCIYDVMKKSEADLVFPLPWASTAETSFLITPEDTAYILRTTGFDITEVEDRTDFALDFFHQSLAAQKDGPAPLGIHLLMGETAKAKFGNVLANIEHGYIIPVQIIATRNA